MAETETKSEGEQRQLSQVNNLLIKDHLDIDASLEKSDLPEKDRQKLKLLREELLKIDLSKQRKKKLWKEIEWVINRRQRNNYKKQIRKKRRLEIRTGVREPTQKRLRIVRLADSTCKIKVALDLSLHDLMTDPERTKTAKQVQRCYAINRRTDRPLQLYLTGLRNAEELTKNLFGIRQWDVFRAEEDHIEHFGKDKVVYLTGDSENELHELCEDEAYIIGAMVDHNRHKGITHKRAVEAGIRHAKLPLDKYIDMKSRKVLTIDHCFQILLNRVNGLSWQESIIQAIPARKGAQLRCADDEGHDGGQDEDQDEGHDQGQDEAHDQGQDEAHDQGQDEAHDQGQDEAHDQGQDEAHDQGQDEDHDQGQDEDHDQGQDEDSGCKTDEDKSKDNLSTLSSEKNANSDEAQADDTPTKDGPINSQSVAC